MLAKNIHSDDIDFKDNHELNYQELDKKIVLVNQALYAWSFRHYL